MATSYETSTTATPRKQKIRGVVRNSTDREWLNVNPVPDKGELVYVTDTNTLKVGDGLTHYADLPSISGGGSGTSDYTELSNKPSINDVTLVGNISAADLGFANVATTGDYNDLTNTPTLANVATTGDYNDLTNLPTLGTMAAESASDYTKTSSFANVAFTGSYDDLVNTPTLGTAAFANTTDFATAAQGELANTALQPGDLANYVTTNTTQTITADKSFSGAKISTNSDIEFTSVTAALVSKRNGATRNLITRTNFNEVNVGNPYDPTVILGNGTRPHYNTVEYLALYSDIPTVNNPTITFTQGGVTKGSITLNQANGDTIAFDGGSSSGTQVILREW